MHQLLVSQFVAYVVGSLDQTLPQGLEAEVAAVVIFCLLLECELPSDRAESLLGKLTTGSSTFQTLMQRLVGLQRMALGDQFNPNRVDAGIHLELFMGFPGSGLSAHVFPFSGNSSACTPVPAHFSGILSNCLL